MNPESKFSQWLIDKVLNQGHAQRIETTTTSGVPDINYATIDGECWIETKIAVGWRVNLRPYQWAWICRRRIYGRVFVIAETGVMIAIFNGKTLNATLSGDHMVITTGADLLINKDDPQRIQKVHDCLFNSIP